MRTLISLLFVLVLLLVCCPIIILYCYFTLAQGIDLATLVRQPETISTAQIITICAVILLPLCLVFLAAPLFRLTPRRDRFGAFLRFVVVLLMCAFIGYQLIDGRKTYQVYTAKDLLVRHSESGKAVFLLSSLLGGSLGPVPTALPMDDAAFTRQLTDHQQDIETHWQTIAPYRLVIEQLAELAVLPQPFDSSRVGSPPSVKPLQSICSIYLAHAVLQLQKGNHEQGITELTTLYRVAAHGLAGSVHIEEKRIWAATLSQTIRAGYGLADSIDTSYDNTRRLAAGMVRLTKEQTTLRTAWLAQYILAVERLSLPPAEILALRFPPGTRRPVLLQSMPPQLFNACYRLLFQKNRTAAELRTFWEPIIEKAATDQTAFRRGRETHVFFGDDPPLRNLCGWYFHRPPDLGDDERRVADLFHLSDLFSAFLQSKLEVNNDLTAYLTEPGRLITSEGNRLRDAGADGVTGTDDDIDLAPLY